MKLKRCPFCNHYEPLNQTLGKTLNPNKNPIHWVECQACGADGPEGSSREEAEKGWNRRDG